MNSIFPRFIEVTHHIKFPKVVRLGGDHDRSLTVTSLPLQIFPRAIPLEQGIACQGPSTIGEAAPHRFPIEMAKPGERPSCWLISKESP